MPTSTPKQPEQCRKLCAALQRKDYTVYSHEHLTEIFIYLNEEDAFVVFYKELGMIQFRIMLIQYGIHTTIHTTIGAALATY